MTLEELFVAAVRMLVPLVVLGSAHAVLVGRRVGAEAIRASSIGKVHPGRRGRPRLPGV